jgi:putative heme-binding domain-containing protein
MILSPRVLCSVLLMGWPLAVFGQNTNQLELRDGDRVVLLGDTFIEREQRYGHIEHFFTTHWPDRNVTFRNLGWSADTPEGISRAGFDPDAKGWYHLTNQIAAVRPTVVFLGYGMANSFAGQAGLTNFVVGINRIIDTVKQLMGEQQVRWLILSPIAHEKLPPPLPDPQRHNEQLALYTQALKEIAAQRNAHFVSLYEKLTQTIFRSGAPLTDNGIHLTDYGYRRAAEVIGMSLGLEPHVWRLGITREGTVREGSYGTKVLELTKTNNYVKFVTLDQQLANPPFSANPTNYPIMVPDHRLQILGIILGTYDFVIDGRPYKRVRDLDLARGGLAVPFGPAIEQAEELRQTIIKKNELFFHRWRPQNNTYLFLFRKHEQGQNAGEIPKFDPLVQEQEAKIAQLRKPVAHVFEVVANTNAFVGFEPPARGGARTPVTQKPQTPFRPQPHPEFQVEPGFEVGLFAENPQLAKPIQMNFDPQGRLWVASSSVYPQIAPGQEADDTVLILEDTDRDGRADKTTVFADGLLIATAVEPGDGGVYVGQSTELLHFKDTDGDGMADEKRIVLSGFGTEDTHHTLHTLRWGYDGQLYMNQSIYIHSHLETPHGVVRLRSGGILNLRPSTMECDIFLKGLINGWGHHYDLYGQSFATDGAGGAPPNGIFYVLPGAMYASYENARRILGSISPGSYPKFCGLEVVYSEHFPPEWQGNMITCDFRANRVVRFAVEDEKSTYVTRQMPDLLRTTNVTFRPVDVKIGPDGALYIADWSNPIINHGEVDFRDARRDRVHGRIWRVTAKGRPMLSTPKFQEMGNGDLFVQLVSSNGFNRHQACRVLIERGERIRADLDGWVRVQADDRAKLEGLWLYQALGRASLPTTLLENLLNAKDGRIRAAAVRVVADSIKALPDSMALLAPRVADDFARVRLEAVRALARIPSSRAAELVLSTLNHPMDEFLDYAVWLSINDLAEPWIASVESGAWKIDGREKQLEFGLKAIPSAQASRVLSKLIANKPIASGNMIELIGQAGGSRELERLFSEAAKGAFDAKATARAFTALAEAARLRNAKPEGELGRITKFLTTSDLSVREAAIRLGGTWKLPAAVPEIAKAAGDANSPSGLRISAFNALREIGNKDVVARLRELAGKANALETRRQAVSALAAVDLSAAVPLVLEVLSEMKTEDEALATWRSVLTVKGAGAALAQKVANASLSEPAAKAGLRAAREGARREPDLVIALARLAGSSSEPQELTRAEIEQIAKNVRNGDPARGESIYRRKELSCVTCHAIGGAGGKVGPDMTSIGASSPVDYLVESLFMPNSKVKEGYNSVIISTKDNDEFSGVFVQEDADQVVLRDATNKEISVPKKNIASRKVGGSLMPAGLLDALSPSERLDLLRFLSELGKPGPYDASKQNIARVWRVSSTDDENFDNWATVFTTVSGGLQKQDVHSEVPLTDRREPFFAAARFQTAKAGKVTLRLQGVHTPKAWLDGKPIGGNTDLTADLSAGVHLFKLKLDPAAVPDQIRLETSDGAFLID